MTVKEQSIDDMAFCISADIQYGIKPGSAEAGRRWLRIAIAWARRNGKHHLEKKLVKYLDEAWPLKTVLPVCKAMPILPVLKAA